MTKGIIVGVIATLLATGLVGGGFYIATRNGEEETVTDTSSSTNGGTIPLDVEGAATTDIQSQQTTDNTKLANFQPVQKIDELRFVELKEGKGETVEAGATITAHYTGALAANGTIFESSLQSGKPIQFSLSQVIIGWRDGVPGMKVGGKRRLLIPAAMAYGESPPPGSGIPANADLVFDIELVSMP